MGRRFSGSKDEQFAFVGLSAFPECISAQIDFFIQIFSSTFKKNRRTAKINNISIISTNIFPTLSEAIKVSLEENNREKVLFSE